MSPFGSFLVMILVVGIGIFVYIWIGVMVAEHCWDVWHAPWRFSKLQSYLWFPLSASLKAVGLVNNGHLFPPAIMPIVLLSRGWSVWFLPETFKDDDHQTSYIVLVALLWPLKFVLNLLTLTTIFTVKAVVWAATRLGSIFQRSFARNERYGREYRR